LRSLLEFAKGPFNLFYYFLNINNNKKKIVENLGEKVIAEYFTRKFDTVHNDEARIKLKKSPKRNITAPAPVDPAVPSSGDSASGSGNINIAPSGLFEDPDFAVGPQLLPDKDKSNSCVRVYT
jgi:hypothetical protein